MAKGTVARIIRGEFGFIKQDEGGEDVYFQLRWVRNAPAAGVAVGMRVEYELRRTPRGLQTSQVSALQEEKKQVALSLPDNAYRFLNPYNFVRALPVTDQGDPLLGRCMPPPHDRYVGLSGRIECKLTAKTPLFTADAEGATTDENGHVTLRFFQYGGKSAIPASSLRGAVRSVFEAATSSCYSVFTGHRRLSYHLDSRRAPQLVPARVERDAKGKWWLRLLTGTTPLQVGRTSSGIQYAAWFYRFWPLEPSNTLTRTPPSSPKVRDFQGRRSKSVGGKSLKGLGHKSRCYALLEEVQHPHPRIKFWDVLDISDDPSKLPAPAGSRQRVEEGWLCLNNQNIEAKHSERFFFRSPSNKAGPTTIELPPKVREEYEDLIRDYQDRHQDEVKKRKDPSIPAGDKAAFSRFVYSPKEQTLMGGELVYVFLEGTASHPEAKFMVPVSVPRVSYERSIGELLQGLHKCTEYDQLCPACRTFGWVYGTGDPRQEALEPDKPIAYAGRVHFTHAELDLSTNPGHFDTTLAILSTPKPTTTRFYLKDRNEKAQDGLDDEQVNYDSPSQVLRGRKIYRHHGDQLSQQEFKRAGGIKDDQNRTLKGIQKDGSCFTFTVRFENLAEIELGALLWSLEMDGWYHRIGLGKPLGFGSAKLQIIGLDLLDPHVRYPTGLNQVLARSKSDMISQFKQAMKARYNGDFDELVNIVDLGELLADSPAIPIHYPRTDAKPSKDGKNFEWFMGNTRSGGPRLTLPLAPDDSEGLPLLDRFGSIRIK